MEMNWIPIKFREPTEEEKAEGIAGPVLTCDLPDDEQDILITLNGKVYIETIYTDTDPGSGYNLYYTDSGVELMDCTAWMPLPEPYRAESEEE